MIYNIEIKQFANFSKCYAPIPPKLTNFPLPPQKKSINQSINQSINKKSINKTKKQTKETNKKTKKTNTELELTGLGDIKLTNSLLDEKCIL